MPGGALGGRHGGRRGSLAFGLAAPRQTALPHAHQCAKFSPARLETPLTAGTVHTGASHVTLRLGSRWHLSYFCFGTPTNPRTIAPLRCKCDNIARCAINRMLALSPLAAWRADPVAAALPLSARRPSARGCLPSRRKNWAAAPRRDPQSSDSGVSSLLTCTSGHDIAPRPAM